MPCGQTELQIDSLPWFDPISAVYLKSTTGFAVTQFLFLHGFNYQFFEFWRISFVWYSFWHSKTPHLLDSISYCLTNGVQFNIRGVTYIYGMFYRFGLIDVPDEAKEKMKKAFSKSSWHGCRRGCGKEASPNVWVTAWTPGDYTKKRLRNEPQAAEITL